MINDNSNAGPQVPHINMAFNPCVPTSYPTLPAHALLLPEKSFDNVQERQDALEKLVDRYPGLVRSSVHDVNQEWVGNCWNSGFIMLDQAGCIVDRKTAIILSSFCDDEQHATSLIEHVNSRIDTVPIDIEFVQDIRQFRRDLEVYIDYNIPQQIPNRVAGQMWSYGGEMMDTDSEMFAKYVVAQLFNNGHFNSIIDAELPPQALAPIVSLTAEENAVISAFINERGYKKDVIDRDAAIIAASFHPSDAMSEKIVQRFNASLQAQTDDDAQQPIYLGNIVMNRESLRKLKAKYVEAEIENPNQKAILAQTHLIESGVLERMYNTKVAFASEDHIKRKNVKPESGFDAKIMCEITSHLMVNSNVVGLSDEEYKIMQGVFDKMAMAPVSFAFKKEEKHDPSVKIDIPVLTRQDDKELATTPQSCVSSVETKNMSQEEKSNEEDLGGFCTIS